MDFLKLEIERKRKLYQATAEKAGTKKYVRQSDLEKQRLEALEAEKKPEPTIQPTLHTVVSKPIKELSQEQVVKSLRDMGEPIRYFGESDQDRKDRFLELQKTKPKFEQHIVDEEGQDTTLLSMTFVRDNREHACTLLYIYFKRLLNEWKEATQETLEMSRQEKQSKALQKQTETDLNPFFIGLYRKLLPDDVLGRVAEIAQYCQEREYQKAQDAYLRLAVGNATWKTYLSAPYLPQTKLETIAKSGSYVLDDEDQRKWVQGIKRLMSFCQSTRPPSDASKIFG